MQITRSNLPEAIASSLVQLRAYQAPTPISADFKALAIATLEDIQSQIQNGAPALGQRKTKSFGAAFVKEEPLFDRALALVVTKVEDIYLRFYAN